jgi:homoserine dehydrogenase
MTPLYVSPFASLPQQEEDVSLNAPVGFRSSGASPPKKPSVHLLGVGKVGKAFLTELSRESYVLKAVTDSRGTAVSQEGLDARAVLDAKARGRSVLELPGACPLDLTLGLGLVAADVVVDATPTRLEDAAKKKDLWLAALRAGSRVVLAGKDALWLGIDELLASDRRGRVGIHAALGGTGRLLTEHLDALRATCTRVAIVANVSTTAVIEALEDGADLDGAIARATALGCLESDPTLDFNGYDAALKLGIVARAVFGAAVDPRALSTVDLRALDAETLRARRRQGATTRLVARYDAAAGPSLAFEEIRQPSALAPGIDRVVYAYGLREGEPWLVFAGDGAGPRGTARALVEDVAALTAGGAR